MFTVPVAVVVQPAPLVAVTVTLYDNGPGGGKVCVGFCKVELVASPKFQFQLTTGGFEPLSVAVNAMGALQALAAILAVMLGPTTVTGIVICAWQVPTVTVNVTL